MTEPTGPTTQALIAQWREQSQRVQRHADMARRVDDGAQAMYHDGEAVTYERCADALERAAADALRSLQMERDGAVIHSQHILKEAADRVRAAEAEVARLTRNADTISVPDTETRRAGAVALGISEEELQSAPPRSIELLRDTLGMLCHFIWHKHLRPGEHLWSIPVDQQRDFDCLLSDAIDELEHLRAEVARLASQLEETRKTRKERNADITNQ